MIVGILSKIPMENNIGEILGFPDDANIRIKIKIILGISVAQCIFPL